MEKNTVGNWRPLCILAILLLASGLLIYWKYIFGNQLFVFNDIGSDTMQQYVMHYQTIINHVKDGNFSFWDFNNGFGTNMFQLNLFDPTLDILYLLGILTGTEHLLYYLIYLHLFRIVMAGIGCYMFLSCFSFSTKSKCISSYIYGLSGFIMVWGQHYQFGIALAYIAFLLYFLERSLHTHKAFLRLSVMSCLQIVYSFYLGYMAFAAAGFYLIFRICYLDGMSIRKKLILFSKRIGNMFLGIGMGAAALLPGAYVVFGISSRMEESRGILQRIQAAFSLYPIQYYKTLFWKFFSGHLNGRNQEYNGYLNYYEDPNVFFSILFLIIAVQYLFLFGNKSQSKKKRVIGICVFLISAIIFLFPFGGIAFNGFASYPTLRFTFVFLPFFALMTSDVLERMLTRKEISKVGLIVSVLIIVCGYSWRMTAVEEKLFRVNALVLLTTGICIAVVLFLYAGRKNRWTSRGVSLLLCGLVAINMICEGYASADNRVTVEKGSDYFDKLYSDDIQDALHYLKDTDPSFYRVEKDFESATYCMDALAQNYRGISTYNSTMNSRIQKLITTCFPDIIMANPAHIRFSQKAQDPEFASLCGIKYLLSENSALESPEYTLVGQFGNIYLYRLELTEAFGKFYSKTTNEENFQTLIANATPTNVLSNILLIEDEEPIDTDGTGSVEMLDMENDSWLQGTVVCDSDGYVMLPVAYEGGWTLTIDGEQQELIAADYGFTAFKVKAGEHEFELKFAPPLLKEGLITSGICCLFAFALFLFGFVKSKKNADKTNQN